MKDGGRYNRCLSIFGFFFYFGEVGDVFLFGIVVMKGYVFSFSL